MVNLCGSCRNCCKGTLIRVFSDDIDRWRREGRYDIILCLETWTGGNAFLIHKKDSDECIFLSDDGCEIYDTRPRVCRLFPRSESQASDFGCLLDPKTHKPRRLVDS